MGLIALVLLTLTITFFTILFIPRYRQSETFHIILGFVEVLIINLVIIILLILLSASVFSSFSGLAYISLYGLGGLGLLQLFYVVPRSLFLKRRQQWARLKGVIAGAVIVVLLNGGCWFFLGGYGGL